MTRANFNSGRTTTQNYQTFFVQDTWKVGNRLTINPGLRYEQETLAGYDHQRLPAEEQLGAAPRRDLRRRPATARPKLFGNYGRFYARVPNDLAARALSADDGDASAPTTSTRT